METWNAVSRTSCICQWLLGKYGMFKRFPSIHNFRAQIIDEYFGVEPKRLYLEERSKLKIIIIKRNADYTHDEGL